MNREVHKEKWHPEPWKTNVESSDVDAYNFVYVSCADSLCLWSGDATYDTDVATAHLISAAPDLYAALSQTCSNALELGYCHMSYCNDCPNMAALRKARGES